MTTHATPETPRRDAMIHITADGQTVPVDARVDELTTKVKKITTTDEGKLQIVLEAEGMDHEALAQVKELLVLQQHSLVLVSMTPVQRELFG
jgi:DNA transposition AAA+ family ATPase